MPLNDILGARNIKKAEFYSVAVDGRPTFDVFKEDVQKAFYVYCHTLEANYLPVEIMAYSVVNNHAYFVVASYDQTNVSVKRYFSAVNKRYSIYYNESIRNVGRVFMSKPRLKKLEVDSVFDKIAGVHSQPSANRLCLGYDDYKYSSYLEYGVNSLVSLEALGGYYRAGEIEARFNTAHLSAINCGIWDPENASKRKRMEEDLERILFKYGCLDRKKLAPEFLEDVIIELNDIGKYDFGYIVSKLFTKGRHKKELAVAVFAKAVLNHKMTYDEAKKRFAVDADEVELVRDIVLYINSAKGYSYDVIMNMLGFTYPNLNILNSIYKKVQNEYHFSFVQVTEMLGLHDQKIIELLR